MDSKGFPAEDSMEEYSFYFDRMFGHDAATQQRYIEKKLAKDKISVTIGHRVLAALLDIGLSKMVFTTNFDEVVETAYAAVTGKSLSTFHREGSYAALAALNSGHFPIYAKVHGDFRYQSIKNITADLLHNDVEIRRSFLAAATRFGLIISGYSGRGSNVITMLYDAIQQNNAFPYGIFWTVPLLANASAPAKGIYRDRAKARDQRCHRRGRYV